MDGRVCCGGFYLSIGEGGSLWFAGLAAIRVMLPICDIYVCMDVCAESILLHDR